jgi:hypothetical protein
VNRQRKSKPKTARRGSVAPAGPRLAGDPIEESLEAARQALEPLSVTESKELALRRPSASPLAVTAPPDDSLDLLVFGATVTAELQSLFERRLAPEDLTLWHSEGPWTPAASKRIFALLDKMIIELAQTFGWRIYLSETVLREMARWHDRTDGPHLIKQLGEAVHLAALVAHGKAKLPVTDRELRAIKPQAVDELRRLLKQSRKTFSQRRTQPSDQEVCELFRRAVEASPRAFPFWSLNIESLLQYFERAGDLVQRMALGDVRPAGLFDEWGADAHNLSPVTFRQSISKLPAQKL